MTAIPEIIRSLERLPNTDAVRRRQNSYALDPEDRLIALSTDKITGKLVLGTESALLEYLYVSDNQNLQEIIFEAPLPRLTHLYAENCGLMDMVIPAGCTALEQIYLQKNKIERIVFTGDCPALKLLDIAENQLTDLLPVFPFLKRNTTVFYEKNLVGNPPAEVVERGREAIVNYFEQFTEQGEDYLFEAKTLVLGKPRAGKTSLTLKIKNKTAKLPEFEETTKGIDVHEWHFELSQEDIRHILIGKEDKQKDAMASKALADGFRVNLWDFGGQEIYTATHQFFLSNRSLYIIVDAEGKEDVNWYDWFYQVEKLGAQSPLLVVLNKVAGRNWTIPNWEKLKDLFGFVRDKFVLNLALLTTEDEKEYYRLLGDIKRALLTLPHIGDPLPRFWTEIRRKIAEELVRKRAAKEQPYITEDRFFEICQPFEEKDPRFGKSQQLIMSQYFHDIGIYLHFQDDQLRRYLFLDANWTTDLVYMLLDDEIVRSIKKGRFDQSDIDRIWPNAEYRAIKGQLMYLLRHFGLAFPVDESKKQYITPYHLSAEKPAYELGSESKPVLEFYYKFHQFMPKGIAPQLTVALSDHIKNYDRVWAKGVVLDITRHKAVCEIEETFQKEIRIRILGSGRKEALAIIINEIEKILKRFSRLEVDEMVPCNCPVCTKNAQKGHQERSFYKHSEMKDRLAVKKYTVDCGQNEFQSFPIGPMLAEVFEHERAISIGGLDLPEPEPVIKSEPKKMEGINKNLIIAGVFAIVILLLPLWKNQSGRVSLGMGLLELVIGKPDEPRTSLVTKPEMPQKVHIKGFLRINDTKVATISDIKSLRIKGVDANPEKLDGNGGFTFEDIDMPDPNQICLLVTFRDDTELPTETIILGKPGTNRVVLIPDLSVYKRQSSVGQGGGMNTRYGVNVIVNVGDGNKNTNK